MPSALSLLPLVSGAASSLVSLTTGIIGSVNTIVPALLGAGQAIVGALVGLGSSIVSAVQSTISAVITFGQGVIGVIGGVISIGQAIGAAVAPVVSGVVGAISAASGVAGSIVGAISGVFSAVSGVVGSVVGVISGVVGGVMSTISGVAGAVVSTFSSVFAAVGPIIGAITSTLSIALSALISVFGALFSAITSIISGIVGAITTIIGAVTSVIQSLSGTLKSVSEALGQVASVAGDALSAFANALQSCIESLISFAHDVSGISVHTGMSLSDASALANNMSAVGISPGETGKMFGSMTMSPELFNERAKVVGLTSLNNVRSGHFASSLADSFQSQVTNTDRKTAMAHLNAQYGGQAPDSVLRVANMNPNKLRANEDFQIQTQKTLGVGSGQIKAASEDLPLLMARVSSFVDTVKMKFAAELLPALEGAFNVVSTMLQSNAGNISSIIQTATHAIFVDGPELALNAAITALNWGSAVADMFANMANAAISFVQDFGSRTGVVFTVLMQAAKFIDGIIHLVNNIRHAFGGRGPGIQVSAVQGLNNITSGIHTLNFKGAHGMVDNAQAFVHDKIGTARGVVASVRSAVGTREEREQKYQDAQNSKDENGETAQPQKPMDSLREMFGQMLDTQKQQLGVSKQHLDVSKNRDTGHHSAGQVLGRIGAYIAEDAYRLTSR